MPFHGQLSSDDDVDNGGREVLRGALHGAAYWGIPCLLAGAVAYGFSPTYRNLTFQFKVFLQMSGMTVGSVLGGERSLREYEIYSRRMRKLRRDQEAWRRFEEEFENSGKK